MINQIDHENVLYNLENTASYFNMNNVRKQEKRLKMANKDTYCKKYQKIRVVNY